MTAPSTEASWNSAKRLYESLKGAGYAHADSAWEELGTDERLAWQTAHGNVWWDGYNKAVTNPINPRDNAAGPPA
jgi:hypothetical protein